MQGDFAIRQIEYGSSDYEKELELRDEILRKPIGMSIYNDNLKGEAGDYHIGAFYQSDLVGVLVLTRLNETEIKMRQVAVKEAYRGQKAGSRLVAYSETFAGSLGYRKIVLNSRKTAVPFYERQGYEKAGNEFIEVTLPHYKMYKVL